MFQLLDSQCVVYAESPPSLNDLWRKRLSFSCQCNSESGLIICRSMIRQPSRNLSISILPGELSDQEASGSEQLITKLAIPPPLHIFPPKNFFTLHLESLHLHTGSVCSSKKEKLPISPSPFLLPLSYPGRRLRNKRACCPWRALPRACVHQNQSSRPTEIPDQEK